MYGYAPVGVMHSFLNLRGGWSLDEAAGDLLDSTEYNNDGIMVAGTQDAVGVYQNGRAIDLDGVNDYVDIPDSPSLKVVGDLTIIAWINRPTITNADAFLSKMNGTIAGPFEFRITGGDSLRLFRGDGVTESQVTGNDDVALVPNRWYMVAVSMAGNDVTYSVNKEVDSGAPEALIQNVEDSGNSARIGISNLQADFFGRIDDVRIYGEAKSQAFIDSVFESADGLGLYSNLIAWWKFDSDVAEDSSQSVNHSTGTTGAPVFASGGQINGDVTLTGDGVIFNEAIFPTLGTGIYSFTGWFKYTTPGGGGTNGGYESLLNISDVGGMGAVDATFYVQDGDKLMFYFDDTGFNELTSDVVADLDDGTYKHFAFVKLGTGADELEFYIDGVAVGTETDGQTYPVPNEVEAGNNHYGEDFPGSLDDFRVYDVALTPEQVATLAGMSAP